MKINILDYNCGNIWSVKNAFNFLGYETNIIKSADQVLDSDCLILPGDGSFKIIKDMRNNNLFDSLNHMAKIKKIPVLGICLGMQLFGSTSEEIESEHKGLNWIEGKLIKFRVEKKIPHIGFNSVNFDTGNVLFKNLNNNIDFYFVHSYFMQTKGLKKNISTTNYGINFLSSFNNDNIFATQFHPEKSQKNGLILLKNFLNLI